MYGKGISKEGELVDLGVKLDVIKKSGAWFSYGDMRLGQGRDNVKEYFKQNKELADEIEAKIRENSEKLLQSAKGNAKKSAEKAPAEPEKSAAPTTKTAAKTKLDIAVDDD